MRASEPEHCCCVIEDRRGRLLLELRPLDARKAPGLLTCFGGKREAGESPDDCLRRELREELAWEPASFSVACDLVRADRFIARFYRAAHDGSPILTEPGRIAIAAPWPALPGLPLAPWHRTALTAMSVGALTVEV